MMMETPYQKSNVATSLGKAIQIVVPNQNSFEIKLDELTSIAENEDIKGRNVVVVSIAGAFRKGKSFLLNFFLKYLNAQYKRHDVSDWLGENGGSGNLNGFKWKAGRKRETTGIWMWSELFTHDFSNGEKIAIILLDTQGTFDHLSSRRQISTTFALSMMLSSVQCYNIMQNIQKDDLENLDMFTDYGRLALQQTNEKLFQELVFIVRDWPNSHEIDYGWNGKQVIDEILSIDDDTSPDIHQSRQRIKSSFNNIRAFLMPYPGQIVAQGVNFTGDLQQIDNNFLKYVKQLVPALFAPENLILKKINNQNVRVDQLVLYLKAYTDVFNSNILPEPKDVLKATAEVAFALLHEECLKFYKTSMQELIEKNESYFEESKLNEVHFKALNETRTIFNNKPKLGGVEMANQFLGKLNLEIGHELLSFQRLNDLKRNSFIIKRNAAEVAAKTERLEKQLSDLAREKDNMKAEMYEERRRQLEREGNEAFNNGLYSQLKASFETVMHEHIGDSYLDESRLDYLFQQAKTTKLQDFDDGKKGGSEISNSLRRRLEQDIDSLKSSFKRWNKSNKPRPPEIRYIKKESSDCTIL